MATSTNNTWGHFGNNFEETLINSVKKAASAGPALANAAMLVAQGCLKRYTKALSALYTANNLPCPDFTVLFDQHITDTPEAERLSKVDEVQRILRHIEDVEELPASVNEVLDILTEFETFEDSTHNSINDESLLKIDDHQMGFNIEAGHLTKVDEVQSILRNIEHVEELPASVNEVLDILTEFDTFEDSTQQSVDNESLLKIEDHQIEFNAVHRNAKEHMLQTNEHDLSFQNLDNCISFGNSPFAITAPNYIFPSTISPICKERIASLSTLGLAKSSHRIRRNTPIRNRINRLKDSGLTPLRRTSSRPFSLAKSMSTLSQATSTPVDHSRSYNCSKTQTPAKSIQEKGESFLIISLSEKSTPHSYARSEPIRYSKPCVKNKGLLNYIRSIIS